MASGARLRPARSRRCSASNQQECYAEVASWFEQCHFERYRLLATEGAPCRCWLKRASIPSDDSAASASLDCLKARAAPTHPRSAA